MDHGPDTFQSLNRRCMVWPLLHCFVFPSQTFKVLEPYPSAVSSSHLIGVPVSDWCCFWGETGFTIEIWWWPFWPIEMWWPFWEVMSHLRPESLHFSPFQLLFRAAAGNGSLGIPHPHQKADNTMPQRKCFQARWGKHAWVPFPFYSRAAQSG